ncbi:hypothetical protein EPC74_05690 [Helicobacter pylori]|nr:hypothetical protein EPC72_00785 [Helicobacter pylori]KAA6508682.1 hypothetical protein EPC74_05690 [Helicobacter pylori]
MSLASITSKGRVSCSLILLTKLLVLVALDLISSLACLMPLLSSSMILSVLLLKCDFCALNSLTRFLASGY